MYPCKSIVKMTKPSQGPAETFTCNEDSLSLYDQKCWKKHNKITFGSSFSQEKEKKKSYFSYFDSFFFDDKK